MRQKLLSILSLIILTNLVFMAADWALIQAVISDPFRFTTFFISTSSLFLIQIFFLAFGFLLGSVMRRIKSVIGVAFAAIMRRPRHAGMYSAAVLLATFIISAFVDLSEAEFFKVCYPVQILRCQNDLYRGQLQRPVHRDYSCRSRCIAGGIQIRLRAQGFERVGAPGWGDGAILQAGHYRFKVRS